MSRRDVGRSKDVSRDSRHGIWHESRHSHNRDHVSPPPRDRISRESPRQSHRDRDRMHEDSHCRHNDRHYRDDHGRHHHESRKGSPSRQRRSRSPVRSSRHRTDDELKNSRHRSSPDGRQHRSSDYSHRDLYGERRMGSSQPLLPPPPPPLPPTGAPIRPRSPQWLPNRVRLRSPPDLPSHRGSPPRLPLHGGSPPRLPLHRGSPPLLPLRTASPPDLSGHPRSPQLGINNCSQLAARLEHQEGYVEKNVRDAFINGSRSGSILEAQGSSAFISGPPVEGMGDALTRNQDESIDKYGMLVPRSLVLEDGTVRTFYSLPPDPVSDTVPPVVDTILGGKSYPPYNTEGLTQYRPDTTDLRYATQDGFPPIEIYRGDFQDHKPTERNLEDHQYGNRNASGWSDKPDAHHSGYGRERPIGPYQNANDGPSQRRSSISPIRDRERAYSREDPISRNFYPSETRRIGMEHRRSAYTSEFFARDGHASPQRRRSDENLRGISDRDRFPNSREPRHDESFRMRVSNEDGLVLHRGSRSSLEYSDSYIRERGHVRSPGLRGSLVYEQNNGGRIIRNPQSPSGEALRHDLPYTQRLGYRSDMYAYPSSIRNARISPRRMRSFSPPHQRQDLHEEERRVWKRKYSEFFEDIQHDRRVMRPHEMDFRKREWDHNIMLNNFSYDTRPSGWDVHGHFDRRPLRECDFSPCNTLGRRSLRDRVGSPITHRRRPPYVDGVKYRKSFGKEDEHKPSSKHNKPTDSEVEKTQQLPADLPEDSVEFKQQVHRAFMKYSKSLNEDPHQRKVYEEHGKGGILLCHACGRTSKPFGDTHSLVMHMLQSKKRGLHAEHIGLCKAVCTIMGWSTAIDAASGKSYQNIAAEEAKANKEDLILWPPTMVVHSVFAKKLGDELQEDATQTALKALLKDLGLTFERMKVASGRQGTVIIKYLATFSCLREAELLHKHFLSSCRGRDDWAQVASRTDKSTAENAQESAGESTNDQPILYGYLALSLDLDKVDLEFQRRCVIRSRKEIEAIALDTLSVSNQIDS